MFGRIGVYQLHRLGNYGWAWHVKDPYDTIPNGDSYLYYTNNNGDGMFVQNLISGQTRQLTGTCQFTSAQTYSGMRRKLIREINHI